MLHISPTTTILYTYSSPNYVLVSDWRRININKLVCFWWITILLVWHVWEEVGDWFAVVGSSDGLGKHHRDVDALKSRLKYWVKYSGDLNTRFMLTLESWGIPVVFRGVLILRTLPSRQVINKSNTELVKDNNKKYAW